MNPPRFHPLVPGKTIDLDWYPGRTPENIEVGQNCVIDSTFCFKEFQSSKAPGLRLGSNVTVWRTSFATEANAVIEVGSDCFLSNASLVAGERISIGNRVFLAGGVTIADSDFHPISPAARLADAIALSTVGDATRRPHIEADPVVIGDDVWIGYNAVVLKGVRIGPGAVITPGAVVLSDVDEGAVVSGNPARPGGEGRP